MQIGDLTVDTGTASVTRDGAAIALPKLSFDLLLALARDAPNLLTIDQLMDRVWPGLVVGVDTVSQRVKLLREALGDDTQAPRYVAGVRGRGYRLVAPVTVASATPAAAISPLADAATLAPNNVSDHAALRKRRLTIWLVAAVAIGIAAVALWRGRVAEKPDAPLPPRSIAVLPFVNLGQSSPGDTLALGVPEAVLHQLAGMPELTVIARTSSFVYGGQNRDVREIGRRLDARYLLEGSVQAVSQRLRVTAQMVDATTGAHVWSMQFDRAQDDLLTLQDDIAKEVARALDVSVGGAGVKSSHAGRTRNFEANLDYMAANNLLATWRLADMRTAAERLRHALRLDPQFAAAYLALSQATLRMAEFETSGDRTQQFEAASEQARLLVEKALSIDDQNPNGYFQRAYLTAFRDLIAAEADYRRGLALAPNNTTGLEGLAVVVNENRTRRAEALQLIDRARRIDPLEPRLDVIKAIFVAYGAGDFDTAAKLLGEALGKNPIYQPALFRLQEILMIQGRLADAAQTGERALQLDPDDDQARRVLQMIYLALGDRAAVQRLASGHGTGPNPFAMLAQLAAKDWHAGAKTFMELERLGALSPVDEMESLLAVRMAARDGLDRRAPIEMLARRIRLTWNSDGSPTFDDRTGQWSEAIALGDLLLLDGQRDRGEKLLSAVLTTMQQEIAAGRTAAIWVSNSRPIALALLGREDEAVRELGDPRYFRFLLHSFRERVVQDPAFERLRVRPEYQTMFKNASEAIAREREKLATKPVDTRIEVISHHET